MMRIADLETPSVLIDLDVMEANLRRWQAHCDKAGLANRPHIKTHKIPDFARRQVALGAVGITCQKLGEAEVMADAGLDDILITYNLLGAAKLARAVALARRVRLSVVADNAVVVEGLSDAFARAGLELDVLVECDTGAARNGVQSPDEAALLAARIAALPGLSFAGLMTYPPKRGGPAVATFLEQARALCLQRDLPVRVVSSGGTPDMWGASTAGGVTEHRAGTYIYNDRMAIAAGAAGVADCAMTVLATVVSRPTADRAVLDCGSKSLAADALGAGGGYGLIRDYPAAVVSALSEEHAVVDLAACTGARPAIGERVRVIPNHTCPVSNLHDRIWGLRGETVERGWTVAARGMTV